MADDYVDVLAIYAATVTVGFITALIYIIWKSRLIDKKTSLVEFNAATVQAAVFDDDVTTTSAHVNSSSSSPNGNGLSSPNHYGASSSNDASAHASSTSDHDIKSNGVPLSSYAPTHPYVSVIHDSYLTIIENEKYYGETGGWVAAGVKRGVNSYQKVVEGSALPFIKGVGAVNAPVACCREILLDLSKRKLIDKKFKNGYDVEKLDPHTSVVYLEYEPVWPTSARDFCVVVHHREHDDGSFTLCSTSVEHNDCPVLSKRVRAKVVVGGWVVRPTDDPMVANVTYLAHVDLSGSLPTSLMRAVAAEQPLNVANLSDVVSKFNDYSPWLDVQEEAPSVEESLPSAIADDEPVSDASLSYVAAAAADSLDGDGLTLSESSYAEFTETLFDELNCEFKTTNDLGADSGWKFEVAQKEILIFRKSRKGNPIHSFMGRGIIRHSPFVVLRAIQDQKSRLVYDRMLKNIRICKEFEPFGDVSHVMLVHMEHETSQCMMKHSRDFALLVAHRVLCPKTGHALIASCSVSHPLFPSPRKNVIRGRVFSSGWHLKPYGPNGEHTEVSYITQVNPRGIPSRLLNVIAVKQPMCIHYLREFLN